MHLLHNMFMYLCIYVNSYCTILMLYLFHIYDTFIHWDKDALPISTERLDCMTYWRNVIIIKRNYAIFFSSTRKEEENNDLQISVLSKRKKLNQKLTRAPCQSRWPSTSTKYWSLATSWRLCERLRTWQYKNVKLLTGFL